MDQGINEVLRYFGLQVYHPKVYGHQYCADPLNFFRGENFQKLGNGHPPDYKLVPPPLELRIDTVCLDQSLSRSFKPS